MVTLHISRDYTGERGTIAAARELAAAFLRRSAAGGTAVAEHTVQAVQLVVSELVTNAVKHTDGPCGVDLELTGQTLKISVWDTSAQLPVVKEPDPAGVGGHGLRIVSALCGTLHVVGREAGKQITVRMTLTDRVTPKLA